MKKILLLLSFFTLTIGPKADSIDSSYFKILNVSPENTNSAANISLSKSSTQLILVKEDHLKKTSSCSKSTTLLLSFFFGMFGVHRFYVGKPLSGTLQFFTAGGFGVWWVIDFIRIACNSFADGNGNLITEN